MSTETKPTQTKALATVMDWTKPTNKAGLESMATAVRPMLEKAMPRLLAGNADRMLRALITSCQTNLDLMKCTPISLFACTFQVAALGLELGGPTGQAYLIPYKDKATLQIGYKGFLQLGYRSQQIARVTPVPVRKGDLYEVKRGMNQDLIHVPKRNNTNPVTDYYVIVELVNGGKDFEEFTLEEAIVFRDRYVQAKNGPWFKPFVDGQSPQEFDEMALKTLIRKLFKRLPISIEAQTASNLDEMADLGIRQNLEQSMIPEFIPAEQTTTQKVEQKVASKHPGSEAETIEVDQPDRPAETEETAKSPPPPPAQPAKKVPPAKPAPKPAPAPKSELHKLLDKLKEVGGAPELYVKQMGYTTVEEMDSDMTDVQKERLAKAVRTSISEYETSASEGGRDEEGEGMFGQGPPNLEAMKR